MDDEKPETLPGNYGQFGTDNATEDYRPLRPEPPVADQPAPDGRG